MTYRARSDGKRVSLLGYGAMRLPDDQGEMDAQVRYLLEHGVNYFDTSPVYCQGTSERRLGAALAASGFAREDYLIATKLSNFARSQWSLKACKAIFEHSLKALRTDYVDNYLLHSVGSPDFARFSNRYLENGAIDWCCELREQRRIRNLGFSFHGDQRVWEWCLEHHDKYRWDFCQIQMNYLDWRHARASNARNLNAEYLYRALDEKGIPVVIMEPLLGGRLARFNWALSNELTPLDPEASLARWAFRFTGSFPRVLTVLSGMTHRSDVEENVETFSPLKPCSAAELAALERAACAYLMLETVPCNECDYCMPCPYGLDIPAILSFRNRVLASKERLPPKEILALYAKAVPEELRRADHCTGCGRCRPHCPQGIDIPKEIARIDSWIDGLKGELAK